jgi:hypothetical protein
MRWFVTARWASVTGRPRLAAGGVALLAAAGLATCAVSAAPASAAGPAGARAAAARGSLPQVGAGAGAPSAQPAGAGTAVPPLPAISTVTLLTGERVELDVTPGGQQSVALAPPAGSRTGKPASAEFTGFTWDGDEYVIPDEAIPYLGSVLDERLFDVSYLVRAGLDDAAHAHGLPVTISYTGGQPPSLPGLHVRHAAHGAASATVAAAQAPQFGRLLADSWHPARTGAQAAAPGTLPGITRIRLAPPRGAPPLPAGPAQSPVAAPAQGGPGSGPRYHTLTLNFTNLNGHPATAIGMVQNLGSLGLGSSFIFATGSDSISVPQGSYSIVFSVLTPHSASSVLPAKTALVVKPQVTVDANTTLSLDARTAKPYSAAVSPAPAGTSERYDELSMVRTGIDGGRLGPEYSPWGLSFMFLDALGPASENPLASTELLATPTAPVTKGTLDFDAASALYDPSPAPGDSPPRYYLVFPHRGTIPSSLSYTVPGRDLTTVHEQIYASPIGAAKSYEELWPDVYLPWGDTEELATDWADHGTYVWPGAHTDYWYSSAPRLTVWQGSFNTDDLNRIWGQRWVIARGQQISEAWNEAPQAPSPAANPALTYTEFGGAANVTNARQTVCPACRQGDVGMLYLSSAGDSDPGHYDDPGGGSGDSLRFYRDGKLAITSAALPYSAVSDPLSPFALPLPMLHQAAAYQLNWTEVMHDNLTAVTTTDWTFHSSPADPAANLPRSEKCAPDAAQGCSLLPLLFLTYHLPLNPQSKATAGRPFQISFTVGHQQNQPPPAGVTATVSASFDNGRTWTAPQRAAGQACDRLTATIQQPVLSATNGFVSLRVTAHDNAGNSVTQTIIEAYGLTSQPQP